MICKGTMAAVWIWALNIAIQPVQGGLRAIIVDCAPKSQQVKACAYASIAAGIGSILGYTAGYVSLPKYVPWLGNTQLKGLCFVASLALGSTVAMTCLTIKEKRYVDLEGNMKRKSFLANFSQIYRSIRTVPRRIKQICVVQFFAWLGWFPFLFYITT
jgi:solute carrier family 45 protein 1/2/4